MSAATSSFCNDEKFFCICAICGKIVCDWRGHAISQSSFIFSHFSSSEAKAGDVIFFTGTYNAGVPVTHVGIYAGNGKMVEAANERKGVIYCDFHNGSVVMYARPNK